MLKLTVIGLFEGTSYGLLAAGIVLVYRTSRTLNLAQGEFGSVAAFVAWALFQNAGVPYGVAVLAALASGAVAALLVERIVIRPLARAPRETLLIATLGVTVVAIAATTLFAGSRARVLAPALGSGAYLIGGAGISRQLVLLAAVAIVAGVALAGLSRRSDVGLALEAEASEPRVARSAGIPAATTARWAWAMAGLLGAATGVLHAPAGPSFFPGFVSLELLGPALVAAVAGGLRSVTAAMLAGEVVGVAMALGRQGIREHAGASAAASIVLLALVVVAAVLRPGSPDRRLAPW